MRNNMPNLTNLVIDIIPVGDRFWVVADTSTGRSQKGFDNKQDAERFKRSLETHLDDSVYRTIRFAFGG